MTYDVALGAVISGSPRHWKVEPFRRNATLVTETNTKGLLPLLSLSSSGQVSHRVEDGGMGRQAPSRDTITRCIATKPDDLVVNPMWLIGGGIGVSNVAGAVSPDYRVYTLGPNIHPSYLHHLLRSTPYRDQYRLYARADTTFDRRISKADFHAMPIILPPIEEQRRIADFLDVDTARMKSLHVALEKQLSFLQMRRKAQIIETVTNASLDAPPRSLHSIAEVSLGRQRAPQHAEGPNMVRYLRAANVKDGKLDLSDVLSMNFTPREQQIFSLQRGDVLVTEGSGSITAVGASASWKAELAGVVCFQNTLLRIRPRPGLADGSFIEWWARSAFAAGMFASIASGANIYHLSSERVRSLEAQFPSLEVQREISTRLTKETAVMDHLIGLKRRQAELLEERRQALVTAAVTGQFDVSTASGRGVTE